MKAGSGNETSQNQAVEKGWTAGVVQLWLFAMSWIHGYPTYVVKLLNNRIKKCRGCDSLFSGKADGSISDPPNYLLIAHEERRPFADATITLLV